MAYTDEQKQMALTAYAACRNNASMAAQFCKEHYGFNVSHDQIKRWSRGEQIAAQTRENANELLKPLGDRLEELSHKLVDKMLDTMDEATFSQLAFALNGSVDKMLVVRGQANQITGISKEEAAIELLKIAAKYESLP